MRHKCILLIFYLIICTNGIISTTSDETEEKKSVEDEETKKGTNSPPIDKISGNVNGLTEVKENDLEKDLLNDFEKIQARVIKMVEAPDLSKSDGHDKKKLDENVKAGEAFKLFFKKQNKLFRKLVAQVEGFELGVDGEGELDVEELENVEGTENFESSEEQPQEGVGQPPPVELTSEEKEGMYLLVS